MPMFPEVSTAETFERNPGEDINLKHRIMTDKRSNNNNARVLVFTSSSPHLTPV
jgi:hypothetical protein